MRTGRVLGTWIQCHARGVAIGIWLTCLLFFGVTVALDTLILLGRSPGGQVDAVDLYFTPGMFALATFGALIIARQPTQVMGWLFCLAGLLDMVGWLAAAYEQFAGTDSLPLLVGVLWIGNVVSLSPILILLTVVPYLFPDGRLLSRRWRPLLVSAIVMIVGISLRDTFTAHMLGNDARQLNANPTRIAPLESVKDVLEPIGFVAIPTVLLGAVASLGLRFRRARGVERVQIRWLWWMLGLLIPLVLTFLLGTVAAPSLINTDDSNWTHPEIALGLTILIGLSFGIPIVLGVAVLRYRLYSIDLLINRTLVYGVLSIGLGALYWSSVVLFQRALDPVTRNSDLAVAASTLAVAALFQPVRRRIQRLVDRHFYRQKYDSAQAIEAFSARMRDELDLDSLTAELHAVVQRTMQPSHVSLWLRPMNLASAEASKRR